MRAKGIRAGWEPKVPRSHRPLLLLSLSDHSASQMRRDLRNFFNRASQRDFCPTWATLHASFPTKLRYYLTSSIETRLDKFARAFDGRRIASKNDIT